MSPLWSLVANGREGGPMGRPAKAGFCHRCRRPYLYGLDDDTCAMNARVTPDPLSRLGEVQATLAGLRTYELRSTASGYHLDMRSAPHITGRPAGSGVVDVLAEHRCGLALAGAPPVMRSVTPPAVNAEPHF